MSLYSEGPVHDKTRDEMREQVETEPIDISIHTLVLTIRILRGGNEDTDSDSKSPALLLYLTNPPSMNESLRR